MATKNLSLDPTKLLGFKQLSQSRERRTGIANTVARGAKVGFSKLSPPPPPPSPNPAP